MRRCFLAMAMLIGCIGSAPVPAQKPAADAPRFEPDAQWPRPLPGNWILGQVSGVAVDKDDNVWIIQRPGSLLDDEKGAQKSPPESLCCSAAPPVMKFDQQGNLLAAWGGAGQGHPWVQMEHGIHVDDAGHVFIAGNLDGDQVLEFTGDGKFIRQFGADDGTKGSNSTTRLGRPAHMMTDSAANELYVADGYGNRRVIGFDLSTGAYKRHWGGSGSVPNDDKLPPYSPASVSQGFNNPVHCVRIARDGLVYVCDRANDRIQVFRKDGSYVREFKVEPQTLGSGSVWDLVLSEDAAQRYIFVADGGNGQVVTLLRQTGAFVTKWGRAGRQPGQFKSIHNIAIDSKGNLYTAEVGYGRRVQRFKRRH